MVWAMDQVDQKATNSLGPAAGVTSDQQSSANQMSADQQAKMTCHTSDCGAGCPKPSIEVTQTNGQPGQLSTASRCPKGKYQSVCCDAGTTMGKCQWRGYRGAGLSCMGGCADGETEVTTNKNNHNKKKGDQTCNGGLQSYCCAGFKPAPTKKQLEDAAKDAAKAAAEAAAAQAALDIAAKAFCRIAVPALLAPLEALEDLIPIVGEILDIAEIAATPALIQGCVKGIEKEGKAEFKIFGKKHSLSMGEPTKKPETRPPSSSHDKPSTSSKNDQCTRTVKGRSLETEKASLDKRRAEACSPITSWEGVDSEVYDRSPQNTKLCTISRHPQACLHYRSVISAAGNQRFNPVTCSSYVKDRSFLGEAPALADWSAQHKHSWRSWMRRDQKQCQRDEWPPAHFWQGDTGQYVRYNHREDNTGAGSAWRSFCPIGEAPTRCVPGTERVVNPANPRLPVTTYCRKEVTLKGKYMFRLELLVYTTDFCVVMELRFTNDDDMPLAVLSNDGLTVNECYPQMLINEPGFAVLDTDSYYRRNGRTPDLRFGSDTIDPALIAGRSPPFPVARRSLDVPLLDRNDFSFQNVTTSRKLTNEEFEAFIAKELELEDHLRMLEEQLRELSIASCVGDDCATERHGSVISFVSLSRS